MKSSVIGLFCAVFTAFRTVASCGEAAVNNFMMADEWERCFTVMDGWTNKKNKHAIVYLLEAPLVFGAQLPQKKQINCPHQNWKTERQEEYATDDNQRHQTAASASDFCRISLPLFFWEKAKSRSMFRLPLWKTKSNIRIAKYGTYLSSETCFLL